MTESIKWLIGNQFRHKVRRNSSRNDYISCWLTILITSFLFSVNFWSFSHYFILLSLLLSNFRVCTCISGSCVCIYGFFDKCWMVFCMCNHLCTLSPKKSIPPFPLLSYVYPLWVGSVCKYDEFFMCCLQWKIERARVQCSGLCVLYGKDGCKLWVESVGIV